MERMGIIMDIMEKVEELRTKANITYEEAKAVLNETNGDMLDAVILLEQRGKIKRPKTEVIIKSSTVDAADTTDQTDAGKTAAKNSKLKNTIDKILHVLKNNFFNVSRKDEELFKMPAWAFVLVLFFFWEPIIPIMIIALFFDIRYSFTGKDDLSSANKFMDKVGSMAEEVTG